MKKIIGLFLSSLLLLASPTYADEDVVTFVNEAEYNLYYEISDGQLGLIERVEVIGVDTFYGQEFLVFKNAHAGFANKRTRGFVRFDAVKSLVPADYDAFKNIIKLKYD